MNNIINKEISEELLKELGISTIENIMKWLEMIRKIILTKKLKRKKPKYK
jgi:hypothetical protein